MGDNTKSGVNTMKSLQSGLIIILSILCVNTYGKTSHKDSSFEAIKDRLITKIKEDGHLEIEECTKLCNKYLKKCLESEAPVAKGTFIYDMFHDKKLHHFVDSI